MITKVDIIGSKVYSFDEVATTPPTVTDVDASLDSLLGAFSDTEEMITINISNPVKRVIKFYNITEGQPEALVEKLYSDMTAGDKTILDDFINTL